ncbi:hypothetical protein [Sulfuriroseicoccus oceanibius]|uniref:PDZ domain-containing protein n=1 Tax=Sulfuriroseicoccus oceanibius TaxID=2707525 RepID=A0A7T7EZG1_9BACT|nr:hypothetical protein [Sulfuriroseicoccus oceanibius]QQL44010.1 hypothetical protein G3M56_008890 [Sulfuriroseicoccus oceanibius]
MGLRMKCFSMVVCGACLLALGHASESSDVQQIVRGVVNVEDPSVEQREAFALAVVRDLDALKLRLIDLKLGDDAALAQSAAQLLQRFDGAWSPDAGEHRLGLKLRWWVELHGDELVYTPLVAEVQIGSLAENNGIRVGDVIELVNDLPLKGDVAPLRFLTMAAMWPQDRPMYLSVRRQVEGGTERLNTTPRGDETLLKINFDQ